MNLFEKIISALQTESPQPTKYGWFHLMFLGLAIVSVVLLCVFCRKIKDKNFRKIVAVSWGVMLIFEIYKQLVFSYNASSDTWNSFPYQLCSTPLYLLPFVAFMKDSKISDGIILFIATFSLFGGLCVYVEPGDVFSTSFLGVHIQTMVHHGLQIVIGIYTAIYYAKKITLKNLFYSFIVFVVMLVIAIVLNLVVYHLITKETFNMFFISPYYPCTLPVLSEVYQKVHYALFFIIYTFGFVFCASLIFGIFYAIKKLALKS